MTPLFTLIAASVLAVGTPASAQTPGSPALTASISRDGQPVASSTLHLTVTGDRSAVLAEIVTPAGLTSPAPVIVLPAGTELTGAHAGYRTAARVTLTPGAPAVMVPLLSPSTPSLSE